MKKAKAIILVVLTLAVAMAGYFLLTHTYINGKFYPDTAEVLNLTEESITPEEYALIQEQFPDCEILWNVPFQGSRISNQSPELTITTLTEEDIAMLPLFPRLERIHAHGCENFPLLMALKEQRPDLEIHYTVTIDGTPYPETATQIAITSISEQEMNLLQYLPDLTAIDASGCDDLPMLMKLRQNQPDCALSYKVALEGRDFAYDTTALTLKGTSPKALLENLAYLPMVQQVTLTDPAADTEFLSQLVRNYPDVRFHWELDIYGIPITTEDTEADFSGTTVDSIASLETAMACFPNLELVYLGECGFDNDELAAYRDRVRADYKVAWLLMLGEMPVRTDAETFMPGRPTDRYYVTNEQMDLLWYCEDMICIDIGHYINITRCDWVTNMSKLKYLVLADTYISDISPLANLKELVFLELFMTKVTDVSPLLSCTALEELNLCYTFPDPEPVKQMTGLTKLWWARSPLTEEEFKEYLPNTRMMFELTSSTGKGWREGEHYYAMRDALGMFYMHG